jgi:pimeloyl-ACP methyl ester carboxylesterase
VASRSIGDFIGPTRNPSRMQGRSVVAWATVLLLLVVGFADGYLTGLARENLSNDGFNRVHERTPADVGLAYEDVTIQSGDLRLKGWWMPGAANTSAANASTTVILVHGHSSTMGKMVRMWAPNLHQAGYSLLAFDLRNHGASPDAGLGYVTYGATEADDVAAAVAFVQDNAADFGVDPDRIVLYGGSMGGATVLNAAARGLSGIVAVISDSAYASFTFQAHVDGAKKGYPRAVVDLVLDRMDDLAPAPPSSSRPDLAVQDLAIPVLLAHCSDDARVTPPNFERLVSLAPRTTVAWEAPCPVGLSKDHHLDGWMDPSYNATVLQFLGGL